MQIFGEPVEAAQKKPLDKNTVSEKMQKTGNTSFVFESLEIEMDDDIFVPIGQLNALRRDALHALEEKTARRYRKDRNGSKTGIP